MGKKLNQVNNTILFCDGGSCQKAGSEKVTRVARAYLRNNDLWDQVHTIKTRCNGRCEDAPTCIVQPANAWYKELDDKNVIEILESHLLEQKPYEPQLLFKTGMDDINSEKERAPFLLKPFEFRTDTTFGDRYETKGFSSDQYLFPLFQYFSQTNEIIKFKNGEGKIILLSDFEEIKYEHAYLLELQKELSITDLVIGPVGKNHPEEIQQRKITSTIYYLSGRNEGGIRFNNKKGELMASLSFKSEEIWKYCAKIQLGGLALPNFEQ